MFAVFSHTEAVIGYFIRQKTKRTLDEVDIYLQSVQNKTYKCLVLFVNDKAVLIVHAGWEQLCAAGKDDSYPFIAKNVMMGLCPSTDEKLESLWLKL